MSQELVINMGGAALATALEQKPAQTKDLFFKAFGIGSQVGLLLPYSRVHESEADRLGLIFMAMAGYDPHGAVDFWQRMIKQKEGGAVPEILSTHPSDQTRIDNLKAMIPEAMGYYRKPY
jgi:predicted Zn-dependent protease